MIKKRITRNNLFIDIIKKLALRSTCKKMSVGCILVDLNNRVVSMGYNSSYPGTKHCEEIGCLIHNNHCIRCLHAEQAALMNLEHQYNHLICYVTHKPCLNCFKLLSAANIKEIRYFYGYVDKGRDLLNEEIKIKFKVIKI